MTTTIDEHPLKAGKSAFVKETFVGFDETRRLILALVEIPCSPVLAGSASPICAFENPREELVGRIRARNRPEVLERHVLVLCQAGIVVLGARSTTLWT